MKKRSCGWGLNETGLQTLESIGDHISETASWTTAQSLVEDLVSRAEQLSSFPHSGRAIPEFRAPTKREVTTGTYRILYRLNSTKSPDRLFLLGFIHGSQLIENTPVWDVLHNE